MRKFSLLLGIVFIVLKSYANVTVVDVRILPRSVVESFIFGPYSGTYSIYGDDVLLTECTPENIFQLSFIGDSVLLKTYEKEIGSYFKIKIIAKETGSAFKIKSVNPIGKIHYYNDDLEVSVAKRKNQLLLINKVNLEDYIAGVVQSEAGKGNNLEYYKLQAILCRTYLLDNLNRHYLDGYSVCSDVHCQAYHNRATEGIIVKAVQDTKGLVVVDKDLNLITAAFHSNCGGETCNSQDVWAQPRTYLKSVKDTFCLNKSQATWQRSISVEDWETYLSIRQKKTSPNQQNASPMEFSQDNGREIYYTYNGVKIPLKRIRSDFKLKSTYFSIKQVGDSLVFTGRGYGHGVGLCQQGAMGMSVVNKSYKEILHFYYQDVILVDLSSLNYFRKE